MSALKRISSRSVPEQSEALSRRRVKGKKEKVETNSFSIQTIHSTPPRTRFERTALTRILLVSISATLEGLRVEMGVGKRFKDQVRGRASTQRGKTWDGL